MNSVDDPRDSPNESRLEAPLGTLDDAQKNRIDYFQKHALPWQMEHIKFRGLGLQVFVAIQGALLVAWSNKQILPIPTFALLSCLSFWLWDLRNRFIISQVHELGQEIADPLIFGRNADGRPKDGVHVRFGRTLHASGKAWPNLSALASHTWAVRVIVCSAAVIWLGVLVVQAWRAIKCP